MKNLKRYVYINTIVKLLTVAVMLLALCFVDIPLRICVPKILVIYLLLCPFILVFSLRNVKRTMKYCDVSNIDIYRDFVTAEKCGRFIVGDLFLYRLSGLTLHLYPIKDIVWIYIIEESNISYEPDGQFYRKHVRKHKYISIWLRTRKEIRVDSKRIRYKNFFCISKVVTRKSGLVIIRILKMIFSPADNSLGFPNQIEKAKNV